MIAVIDNYDSFVENLARFIREEHRHTRIVRNDKITVETILSWNLDGLVLSPGPKMPREAGICVELIQRAPDHLPILGVCLGHQCLVEAYGGKTIASSFPTHGRRSKILHNGCELFEGLPSPLWVGRYHSLASSLSENGVLTDVAYTENSVHELMAVTHRTLPRYGLQFHPESILTDGGRVMIRNFLTKCTR